MERLLFWFHSLEAHQRIKGFRNGGKNNVYNNYDVDFRVSVKRNSPKAQPPAADEKAQV